MAADLTKGQVSLNLSQHQNNSLGEVMPKETSFTSGDPNGTLLSSPSHIPNHQRDDFIPLKLREAHSYQLSVESTAAPEQNSEEGHLLRGVLQSDPALKGPGMRTISLDEKVAPDAALPPPQKRPFGD